MGELLDRWKKSKSGDNSGGKSGNASGGSLLDEWRKSKKYRDVDTSRVDDAYFESYNANANAFFSDKELRDDSYDKWQALNEQAETIRAWAWQNKDALGGNYDTIMSATDLSEAGQYWNQFGSSEDYAKAFGDYASYNEMLAADLGALEDEIATWEGRVTDLEAATKPGYYAGQGRGVGDIFESMHYAKRDYDKANEQLSAKRAYYNEAKNLQAGKKYDESARLDPNFAKIAEQGGRVASDTGRIQNLIAYYRDPETAKAIKNRSYNSSQAMKQMKSYEFSAAQLMSDDEFATYNYLLGKGDTEGAAAYLKSLEYQINLRGAENAAAGLKGKTLQEVMWAVPVGLNQFGSGIKSAASGVLGNDGYITPSAIQLSSGKVREDLADDGFKVFGSSVGQLAYDTLSTTANMAPSILASAALNMVAPGAGTYVGAGLMGASAGGNAYAEALNNGYSRDSARLYGLSVGASEAALQSVLGGIGSMAGAYNITEEVLISKANAINNALLRVAAKYGIKVAGETLEEELQNFLEPLFKQIFLGGEYDAPTIEELVQTAIITAISTGALESSGIISSEVSENKTYKDNYGAAQNELVAEGLELDPQSRYYQRLNEKLNRGKDLSGNEIRNVVTRNERAISRLGKDAESADVAEIAEEKAAPDTMTEMTAQNAPKIEQERTESADVQTVTERENVPDSKETAEQAEATRETSREDVQTQLEVASRDYGAQAKAMVATYIEGQDVSEYNAAFRIAYDMGASGVNLSYVEGMDSYLTDSQKKIAYEAGKASQDAKAKRLEKSNAKKQTGGTVRRKGTVRGDGVSIKDLSAKFNDTQRQAYTIMSTIAEVTGIDIVLYKSEADATGNFSGAQGKYKKSEPGTLYIDVNAGLNNIKSAGDLANYTMLRTFTHEFVHFIENFNPVWYNELRRAVFDHLENADELISHEAAESGLPYERASREVVAEALTDVLPDSTFIEDLANNHKNIFEKLYAKFKEFAANIKKHFASLSPNANKAAQTLKQSGKYAEEIVKLFDKAAASAVENYQATVAEQEVKAEPKAVPKEKSLYEKYSEIKEQHPDSIVLYRVGDFYEILGEDAKVASEAADLTLAGRNDPVHGRVSMVGFPYRKVGAYAEKLRTVSRVAIVEADGNVIEMAKAEPKQIDQEKPKKAKKPKKIASTEAVIPEESADAAQVEQESTQTDVTVEQAKKNLKKAITMPVQGTNEEALLAGIISKELTFEMVSYHGNFPGFSPVQRAHLVQKLIEGVYTDDKVIKIDVPYDGKFEINNTPENVANVLNALKVRVPQEIVWDKKAYTHFKNASKVAVMKHGGQDYITDGGLMLPITDAAARIATKDLRAEFREYPEGFDEIVANATVPIKNAPYEAEIKGRAVYVFDIGGEKVYFDKKRFSFIDGGVLTYAKGEKFSLIKSVNEDGNLIGYLINVRSPKTDIEDGKPTKLKSFSKKKGAKGEVQYQSRAYTDQDQAFMDAVESGDMVTAQRMVDEAAKEAGYTYHLYHGTNADFTKFDLRKYGGKNGKGEGYGIYLAENREISAPYGKNVIDSYTKFNRLAEGGKKTLSYAEVKRIVKKSCEIDAKRSVEDGEYNSVSEAIRDTWVSNYVYTYDYSSMSSVYADVAKILWENNDNDGELINEIMASLGAHYDYHNALSFYENVLTPETGIDGFHYIWGNKDGSGVQNDIYLAFNSEQIKSADPVTYDDDGNVIPLSERFDEAQEDIRYQRRDSRMTDQEVLAYAVDLYKSDASIAKGLTEAEKGALGLFKQRLGKLDGLIAERAEQGRIYRENTFQKGGDRDLAQKAHNRMEVLDGQIASASAQLLDVQEKTVLQGVLQKARKVVEQQERARGDEKLKRWRDRRKNAAQIKKYRDRIEADYKDLVDWLNHPLNKDVTKHVNENIKGIVIPFLMTFDFTSQRQLRGGEATKADKAHVKQAQKLLAMLDGLDEDVRYSGEYDLPLNFSERLAKHVETVQNLMDEYGGEMVINRMTAEELRELSLLMANLKTAITTLNKFHTNAMFAHVSAAGDTTIRDLKALKDYDGNAVDTFLFWKNIRPDYAWERFGSGGRSINLALREGQSKLAWNAKEIIDYAQSTFTAKEREEWENKVVEVSISDGRKVKTTVAALMSFYELSKRGQGRKHILDGGVTVSDVEIRESKFAKKKRVSGRYGRFTEADIEAMNAALTDRQREVADKLQQFMEKQGGEWGNHVTLARFGERAFGEKGYFPISVDKQSLSTNTDKQIKGADLYRLLNMGFTKELSENTKQPLLLYSIFDVFSTHMADMAQYNAMALPVLDAIRWLNYKEYDLDTGVEKNNLRAQMKRAFGSPVVQGRQSVGYAESFVLHILQAYNGTEAQGTPGDSLGMKMLHTYNRAQIAFNVRVVVQQPMALTRAAMILDPKYIAKALDPKKIKASVEDMLAHSGIAAWKDLGYYDINISRGLAQMIKQESTFTEKITEVGLKPAEWADKATWGVIWAACKMQLAAEGVTDYAKIEQLFDDVIYKTQVVDSVLTKSEYMRDKGFFARSTASFMSEPTTTASMVLDAYDQFRMDLRKGMSAKQAWSKHKKNIGRTVLVYSVGAIMLAAVQAAADGLRDDDDYQNLAEKWNEAFWSNLLDELSPVNKLPLINTTWELIKVGLDTFFNLDVYGNPPSAAWAQWFDTLAKAWEVTMELIDGDTNYTWYAAIYKYLQVASGLTGVPFAALTREVITVWNNSVGAFAPSLKVKSYELKEETEIKYAVLDGYLTENEAADELYDKGLASSREEAELTAEAFAFVKDHPEYSDLTVSAYALYKENCQGVDVGYFYQAWKYYNQTDADRDKNGEPISGSKKRKVLDFIYQMPITPDQKRKLIKCFYN